MAHTHSVYDSDTHFSINPVTRVLRNEASGKTSLIQYDHNSERFTFEIPRIIEGHDMSLCNVIRVHYINIDSKTKAQVTGVYEVEDMQISPNNDDVVICSWLISRNATQLVGSLNFLIRFSCITDGVVDYAWNTATYTNISISSGINADETFEDDYADVIAQWRDSVMKELKDEAQQQLQITAEQITQETNEYIDDKFKGQAGIIYPLATAKVPKGFLLCDGAEYSRTDYVELFEAIGTTYGAGDGENTFNVPDLSTRVPVGTGEGYDLGKTGGEATHTLTTAEMPSHRHSLLPIIRNDYGDESDTTAYTVIHPADNLVAAGQTVKTSMPYGGVSGSNGEDQPHNNMQPYTVVNYIISTGKEVEFVVGGGASIDDEAISEDSSWSSQKISDKLADHSQGRSAKYNFTTPGWKRVLNIIRASGGTINFGVSQSSPLYMCQAAGVVFSGFVKYGNDTSTDKKPVIYQLYNNIFGENNAMQNQGKITKVRIAYPDPKQPEYNNGTLSAIRNPINCYLEVYVEFDKTKVNSVNFNLNYAGFADSHECEAITDELDADDVGIYGEDLLYHEFALDSNCGLYMPDISVLANALTVTDLTAKNATLPGYAKTGLATAIPFLGLNKDDSTFGNFGFKTTTNGSGIVIAAATNSEIRAATNNYKSIVPANFKYAFDHHIADILKRIEALEALAVKEITFKVWGTTYTAQEGMTWSEFLISKYNPTITCTHCGESKKLFVKNDRNDDINYLYDNDCQQEMAVSISVEDVIIAHTYDTIIPDFHYDLQ